MTTLNPSTRALPRLASHSAGPGWLAKAAVAFNDWIMRSRAREELRQMDERLLKDIGVTRAEATAEGDKYFWQP